MLYYFGRRFWIFSAILFFSFYTLSFSQTKTNLNIYYMMVDSSGAEIINSLPENSKTIKLKLDLPTDYSVFGNKLIEYLTRHGIGINQAVKDSGAIVNYVIDKTSVSYPETFRNGLLGTYYTKRNLKLGGNFALTGKKSFENNFLFSYTDSVQTDSVKYLQNEAFSFTQGEMPAEPFFASLLEPAVAIGAVAVAVILFFTVRSK